MNKKIVEKCKSERVNKSDCRHPLLGLKLFDLRQQENYQLSIINKKLISRPTKKVADLTPIVSKIFNDIKRKGDVAVKQYAYEFDKVKLLSLAVSNKEIQEAPKTISPALKKAILLAKKNIEKFHLAQKEKIQKIETTQGVVCWREHRAIEKVGIYIPGGTAPLFSTVLMLGVPAKIAGCQEIVLCTPSDKEGKVHPAILYTASLMGIKTIFKVGGIQAIGAMTLGTQTIPKVDKIFGPGNQYVTAAKQMALQYGVAIDMPAGPSEVLIIADKNAVPAFVAADLLSQAEHGVDSQVMLLSDNKKIADNIVEEIQKQLPLLPRQKIAQQALKNSKVILLNHLLQCVAFSNLYAPEHLIMAVKNPKQYIKHIHNAGSVFLGNYSCESAGDYASGTNHTLPTNGYARSYSGVSLDSFVKKITFQEITAQGIQNIGNAIEVMAEAEQLIAHRNAVTLRLQSHKSPKL